MLVKGKVANLVGGISQQAAPLRLPTQSEIEVNTYPVIVDGNRKRPPAEHVAVLGTALAPSAFSHFINRDEDERYVVAISGGVLTVTALDGTPRTVTNSAPGYLTTPGGVLDSENFAAVSIADYTFITNKSVVTAMASTVQPTRAPEALLNIIEGEYGRTYSVSVNGTTVGSNLTPFGTDASQSPWIDTAAIGATLMKAMTGSSANGTYPTRGASIGYGTDESGKYGGSYSGSGSALTVANGWNVVQVNNTIWIQSLTGVDFQIGTTDGFGGEAMKVSKGSVKNFTDLPNIAPDGYTVKITGDANNASAAYYVQFSQTSSSAWTGTWVESAAPGYQLAFDATTMPHILVRNADGSFTFQAANWNQRDCGDSVTSPNPSFVGSPIADVLLYQNRLGFFSQDNVVLSRSGDFFNFFRTTATEIVDDDPIDVNAATQQVSLFRAATPYQQSLILWSDTTQFSFSGTELLTPKTVNMNAVTPYDSLARSIKPLAMPRRIFFATDRNEYVGLREWYYDVFYRIGQADDDAAHVPTLIPTGAYRMVSSTIEDVLFLASTGDVSSLWVYKYQWQASDKLQSAWTQWTFPGAAILNVEIVNSELYMLVNRGSTTTLEKVRLYSGLTDSGAPVTHLDRRVTGPAGTFNPSSNTTAYVLPYGPSTAVQAATKAGSASGQFYAPAVVGVSGSTVTLQGDTTAETLWFGEPYVATYQFSPIYVRDDTQQGALQEGRLQLLKLDVMYQGTGYFRVQVTPAGRGMRVHEFNPWEGGDALDNDGSALFDGIMTVPVISRSDNVTIQIVNDTFFPSAFVRAEWKGNFVPKARK